MTPDQAKGSVQTIRMMHQFLMLVFLLLITASCEGDHKSGQFTQDQEDRTVKVPAFDAELAYQHIVI